MFFGEEESPFQSLPPEMVVSILNFVDFTGKRKSRSICRRWRWILDHSSSGLLCFKLSYGVTTKQSIEALLKSQVYMENVVLNEIKMAWPVMTYSRNKFPPIRRISLDSGNCEKTVFMMLQYGCAQTRSLTLGPRCFNHVRPNILSRVLSGIKWNQLTELSVRTVAEMTESLIERLEWDNNKMQKIHAEGIEQIFKKATVPNLKILNFYLFSCEGPEISTRIIKLMSGFVTFIESHSKTLKELKLAIGFDLNGEDIFPNIPSTVYSPDQQKSIARNLKLESLDIWVTDFDILVRLVPPCLLESDKLTKLFWCPHHDAATRRFVVRHGTPKPIQSLIQRNRNTLANVWTIFILGDIGEDPFEISWLKSCSALTELTIENFEKILNVQIQFPSVKKLDVGFIRDYNSIQDVTNWIHLSFANLEILQILIHRLWYHDLELDLDWIQSLFVLPGLRGIRLRWFKWWRKQNKNRFNVETLIRQFCQDKPKLTFTSVRQRGGQDHESCLIKILPLHLK